MDSRTCPHCGGKGDVYIIEQSDIDEAKLHLAWLKRMQTEGGTYYNDYRVYRYTPSGLIESCGLNNPWVTMARTAPLGTDCDDIPIADEIRSEERWLEMAKVGQEA